MRGKRAALRKGNFNSGRICRRKSSGSRLGVPDVTHRARDPAGADGHTSETDLGAEENAPARITAAELVSPASHS